MMKRHKKSLFIPLLFLLIIFIIGVGFIITLIKSMDDYTIIKEQEVLESDINLQKDIDFGLNFVLRYSDVIETNSYEDYQQNTITLYHLFYRFLNLEQFELKKYNHDNYDYHLLIDDNYYINYDLDSKYLGIVNYDDNVISFSYLDGVLNIQKNNVYYEFIFQDRINIKVTENNEIKYLYEITYQKGTSYCEMEIITMFNNNKTVEKYILNKAVDKLYSHYACNDHIYSFIITKENNEYQFIENNGGKYD